MRRYLSIFCRWGTDLRTYCYMGAREEGREKGV